MYIRQTGHGPLEDHLATAAGQIDGSKIQLNGAIEGHASIEEGGKSDGIFDMSSHDAVLAAGEEEHGETVEFLASALPFLHFANDGGWAEAIPDSILVIVIAGGPTCAIRVMSTGFVELLETEQDPRADGGRHGVGEIHLAKVPCQRFLDRNELLESNDERGGLRHVGIDEILPRHGGCNIELAAKSLGQAARRCATWRRHRVSVQ